MNFVVPTEDVIYATDYIQKAKDIYDLADSTDVYDVIQRNARRPSEEERYDIVCNTVQLRRDRVAYYEDVAFSEAGRDVGQEVSWFRIAGETLPTQRMDTKTFNETERLFRPVLDWYEGGQRAVCQDGIRLPVTISEIAPVGATAGMANFVADSRLSLNVTRNAIDKNPAKLAQWRKRTGFTILTAVAKTVNDAVLAANLDVSWENVWLSDADETALTVTKDWTVICESLR
jgi:hypothetical protein